MTAATKTKPTKSREAELADLLTQHRGVRAELEQQATDWERQAVELDARAEERLADFTGSVTELPEGVDKDRDKAEHKRRGAADLRKRAQAYAASVGLEAIAAEHEQLRSARIAAEELEAATKEAAALTAELDIRAAWLFRDFLQAAAIRARYLEAGNRLMELTQRHQLKVDAGRYANLAVRAQELAGQHQRLIISSDDPDLWRQHLPVLEQLDLPAELRAPATFIPTPAVNQGTRVVQDPKLPKDYAIRMAGAAVPAERNADGTLAGVEVHEWGGGKRFAPVPRTEAEERAKRRELAAQIAAEDQPAQDGA